MCSAPYVPGYQCGIRCDKLRLQAKDCLHHPYFDDLDKDEVDLFESESIRAREA